MNDSNFNLFSPKMQVSMQYWNLHF